MAKGFIYLASPYTHPDPHIREVRYQQAKHCLGYFLRARTWVYAPIVHCHQLALDEGLPHDHKFWQDYDEAMILASEGVYVLCIDGWIESKGVKSEIAFAQRNGKSVSLVHPDGEEYEIMDVNYTGGGAGGLGGPAPDEVYSGGAAYQTPILNEREKTHGDYATTAEIAQLLKATLRLYHNELTMPQRESLDNIAVKLARILSGDPNVKEHWADIAGYANLISERL